MYAEILSLTSSTVKPPFVCIYTTYIQSMTTEYWCGTVKLYRQVFTALGCNKSAVINNTKRDAMWPILPPNFCIKFVMWLEPYALSQM